MALGQIEFYLPKPAWSPDEQFHQVITEALKEWWRQHGAARLEAVTVIGEDPSARAHEIRDILARNNVPFGFIRRDSAEGRAALRRLGVPRATGPVVALYTGAVLVDPSNVEVAAALGQTVRPTPARLTTSPSSERARPGWPRPSTAPPKGSPPCCWSGRRSAARPGPAP
jgi:hypothetical protein